ncbi:MAG TPA: hypothetical protein VN374_05775 [Desulfitobacteriaceae bacterium]|nr:hypothetical protein [Desulfitobacteriaceae bacterium]
MDYSKEQQLCSWARIISLAAALTVCLLSLLNGVTFGWLVFRVIITFSILYGLIAGSLIFFRKTAQADVSEEMPASENNLAPGRKIDISLGDEVNIASGSRESDPGSYAGQVDPALVSGIIGNKQQADIIRRMGWKEE